MSSIHCNKFFSHVFKPLFITKTPITPTFKRKVTTCPPKVLEYNRSIRSYAMTFKKNETSQKEAIKLLQDMKTKGIEPNSQTWLHLVIGMSFQRHRSHIQNQRLEEWLNNLISSQKEKKKRSSLDKFKKVLSHLSLHGHPKLLEMFLNMNTIIPLPIECWYFAMKGCIKSKNIQDAVTLLDLLRQDNLQTITCYEIIIEAYLYLNDQSSASKMFSIMLQDNITATYNTYQLFINYYMKLPYLPDHAETLFKLWQAILITTNKELPQDMIQQYISYFGKHGELSKAEQIYLDVKSTKLNRRCVGELNKIIIGFSKRKQLPSALSIYYDLIGQGYKPSKNVLDKITKACKERKDEDTIKQLTDIIKEHCNQ